MRGLRGAYVVLSLLLGSGVLLGSGGVLAQEVRETTQDWNLRLQSLAAESAQRNQEYRIGAGDLLGVSVFDVPDLSRDARVGNSGYISLPLIPTRIKAAGLSPTQLEEKIAELLVANQLVKEPQVTVFVKEYNSQPVAVMGAVRMPTLFQVTRPTTLLEALSRAGGLAEEAAPKLYIMRQSFAEEEAPEGEPAAEAAAQERIEIDLQELIKSGDLRYNVAIFGGDTIHVPRAGVVYVVGAVNAPGGFVLKEDRDPMTVVKAIALAGGLKSTAMKSKAVIVKKGGNPEDPKQEEVAIDVGKILARQAPDRPLAANDVLFVPDSAGKKVLGRIGEIALQVAVGSLVFR